MSLRAQQIEQEMDSLEEQRDELIAREVVRLTPILLERGAKKPLTDAPHETQAQIVARECEELRILNGKLNSLSLQWNIEEGMY